MQRQVLLIFLFGSMLALAACRNAPLVDIESAPLNAPSFATSEQIENAIKRAGQGRGWEIESKGPGVMTGTLVVRNKHKVVVNITYDRTNFSIIYLSSENMNYAFREGVARIHPSYSKWTKFLKQDIQRFASQI